MIQEILMVNDMKHKKNTKNVKHDKILKHDKTDTSLSY